MSKDDRPSPPSEADAGQAGSGRTATTAPAGPLEATESRKREGRQRLKRLDRQIADLRQSHRALADDVRTLTHLGAKLLATNTRVLDRLDAIAAHRPAQGARSSPAGADGAPERAAGTPFGFWATAGLGLLAALASLLGGFVFLAALQGAGAPGRGFALAAIMAGIAGLAAVVAACALRQGTSVPEYLALRRNPGIRTVFWWTVAAFAVNEIVFRLIPVADPDYDPTWWWSEYMHMVADAPRMFALSTIVVAPLAEEALFRGFLFAGWSRSALGATGAIVVTSALWAAIHVQYGIHEIAAIFALGIVLGYARHHTGSLWVPILMHGFFNLLATITLLAAR